MNALSDRSTLPFCRQTKPPGPYSAVAAVLWFLVVSACPAATLTVTDSGDEGPGTLRQALLDANADSSSERISIGFSIPGAGIHTVTPLTALPGLTRTVMIDGYTQPDASPNTLADGNNAVLLIQLTGTSAGGGGGLFLQSGSDGSVVRGLVINGFSDGAGISLLGTSSNSIVGNFIGTDASGQTPLANQDGVFLQDSSFNTLGGATPAERNIISGNSGFGIGVLGNGSTNNALVGNHLFANGGLGIDLGEDGVTANDSADTDEGPNHGQNFPELDSASLASGDLTIRYRVDSASENSAYPLTVEFLLGDTSGSGKTSLYRHTYDTPQAFTTITFTPAVTVNVGDPIVATATDANGNTSEFCPARNAAVELVPVYEGFIYATGPLAGRNGGTGLSDAWSGASGFTVVPSSISFGGPASGSHLSLQGDGRITRRLLQPIGTAGTVRYVSFVVQVLYPPFGPPPLPGGERVGIVLDGTNGAGLFVGKPATANFGRWALENATAGGQVAGPPILTGVPSAQALLVVKCEFFDGVDRFTLYVNPSRTQPEPASGAVKFDSDVGTITNISFAVSSRSGFWDFDEIRLAPTFAEAIPTTAPNQPPFVTNPIDEQHGTYGLPFTFTFAADTFTEPDVGQTLSYAANGLPPGITFNGATRTFDGTNRTVGSYEVTLTATDNGTPPLSADTIFNFISGKAVLTAEAYDRTNSYGDPIFVDAVTGVDYSGFAFEDGIFDLQTLPTISTTAHGSPAGTYPIQLSGGSDSRYSFAFQDGLFTLVPAPLTVVLPHVCRLVGAANPPLSGRLVGLRNNDPITLSVTTVATTADPPGIYAISGQLLDPNGRLPNYVITTLPGELNILAYDNALDVIHAFGTRSEGGVEDVGIRPSGAVMEGPDGVLYGLTALGGTQNQGTVFRVNKDGTDYRVLRSMSTPVAFALSPPGPLILGTNGLLYGVASGNGTLTPGNLFSIDPNSGDLVVRHTFSESEGANPNGPLLLLSDGLLYGTTSNGRDTIYRIAHDGSGFTVLWQNPGVSSLPAQLASGLIEGSDGLLYGTSVGGGDLFHGTLFSMHRDGSGLKVLHSFAESGAWVRLLEARDGWLYGTTAFGGIFGEGSLFKLAKDGSGFEVLHHFDPLSGDGAVPFAALLQGNDGYLYGTTRNGGTSTTSQAGTVYRLNTDGTGYCVVRNFGVSAADPSYLTSELIQASDGLFYGTSEGGGGNQIGTVYRLAPLAPPTLSVTWSGIDAVTLSWFPVTPGFKLQQSASLNPLTWVDALNGNSSPVIVPVPGAEGYYRLSR